MPTSYVEHVLSTTDAEPPITWTNFYKRFNWLHLTILTVSPSIAIYGLLTTRLTLSTALWSIVYYFVTGLGTFHGYDRC